MRSTSCQASPAKNIAAFFGVDYGNCVGCERDSPRVLPIMRLYYPTTIFVPMLCNAKVAAMAAAAEKGGTPIFVQQIL